MPNQDDDEKDDQVADFRDIITQLSGPQLNNMYVADWLACDAALDGQEKMTDEEIQETVTNQEEEEDEEIPCQHTGTNAQGAIQRLDIITWLFQDADVDPIHLLNPKAVRRVVLSKGTTTSKQIDIRAIFTRPLSKQSKPATPLHFENGQATG